MNDPIGLGDIVDAGGVEYVKTAKGFVALITGDIREELQPGVKVRRIRRAFGLPIKEEN